MVIGSALVKENNLAAPEYLHMGFTERTISRNKLYKPVRMEQDSHTVHNCSCILPLIAILTMIRLFILMTVQLLCKAEENLLMAMIGARPDRERKASPYYAWSISPSWLYLILPIIMFSMYMRMKWEIYRFRKAELQPSTVPTSPIVHLPGHAFLNDSNGLQLIATRCRDPELEAIAHLLGRELSLEEWGQVRLRAMTDRQLQALGFLPGCPLLNAPQYRGKSVQDVAKILGLSDRFIEDHKATQTIIGSTVALNWSGPSRIEEVDTDDDMSE
jgi:hypothetical protein